MSDTDRMLVPPNLPIANLRTFVAIVDEGGFTHAAHRLRLTQPTVSQQLKKLEQLVGHSLLNRSQRKLAVTEPGRTLLEYSRRILMLNDEAVAKLTTPNVSGALRLGLPHEFTISILPQLVGVFSQTHPNVVIEVECELSKTLLANASDYDLVIALHDQSETSGKQLRSEPLVWVSNPDYRFPTEPDAELPIIAAPDPCIYRDTLQGVLKQTQRKWALRLTSTSYGAVCAAVSTGMGITVLARSAVPQDLGVLEHDVLPPLPEIDLRLHCDWPSANSATRTFVKFVTERLTQRGVGAVPT